MRSAISSPKPSARLKRTATASLVHAWRRFPTASARSTREWLRYSTISQNSIRSERISAGYSRRSEAPSTGLVEAAQSSSRRIAGLQACQPTAGAQSNFHKKNRPVLPGGFSVLQTLARKCASAAYSPLPKRRDHQPALRGWVSVSVSEAVCAGAEAGVSGWLGVTGAGASGWALVRKLTFSRTVERRRAAAPSVS